MNALQRQKFIVDLLNKQKTIQISDISQQLQTTRETIRKDIYALDAKGMVHVIRGGATLPQTVHETKYGQRQHLETLEKEEIANTATKLIHDKMSIFLDYGTTAFQIAESIKKTNLSELTVITNSTFVLASLQFIENISIVMLGGMMRTSEGSISGPMTLQNIDELYADIGFFGCGGVSKEAGITNHYIEEVEVSKKMMQHCKTKVFLADHTKFGKKALYKSTDLNNLDFLISDSKISPKIVNSYTNRGISIISDLN